VSLQPSVLATQYAVILSFILSHGVLFLLVSLAIKVETCDGYTTVQQLGHTHSSWDTRAVNGPQRRRAIYRGDGTSTHREWVVPRDDVRFTEQMGHACTVSVSRRACSQNPEHTLTRTVFSQFAVYYLKFMHVFTVCYIP